LRRSLRGVLAAETALAEDVKETTKARKPIYNAQ